MSLTDTALGWLLGHAPWDPAAQCWAGPLAPVHVVSSPGMWVSCLVAACQPAPSVLEPRIPRCVSVCEFHRLQPRLLFPARDLWLFSCSCHSRKPNLPYGYRSQLNSFPSVRKEGRRTSIPRALPGPGSWAGGSRRCRWGGAAGGAPCTPVCVLGFPGVLASHWGAAVLLPCL